MKAWVFFGFLGIARLEAGGDGKYLNPILSHLRFSVEVKTCFQC